jgi:uncharacterized protein (TIGR02246 family)
MKRNRVALSILVTALTLLLGFGLAQGDDAEAREVVEGVKQQWVDLVSQQDAAGLAQLFTEDGQFFYEGGVTEGREALEEMFGTFFDSGLVESSVPVSEAWLLGDTAFAVGEATNVDAQGEFSGNFLEIFKQEDGEWKIYRLMSTASSMPEGTASGGTMSGGGN